MYLTKAQEQILNMERIVSGAAANIGGRLLFKTDCDAEKMEEILRAVFTRNDAFSLRLKAENGQYSWEKTDEPPARFAVLRFEGLRELDSYGERITKEPLALTGPLYDFKIVFVEDMVGIVGRVHHLIADAWSISLLGRQISALLSGGDFSCYSYREYMAGMEDYLRSPQHQRDKEFFASQLQDEPEDLGLMKHPPTSYHANRKTMVIPQGLAGQIRSFAAQNDAFPYAVLLTGFAVCLSRLCGNAERFFIGMTALNRAGARENNTFGLFINTIPCLFRLNNGASFRENMSAVIDDSFSALRHAKYTYTEQPKGTADLSRLFEVVFNYQTAKLSGTETDNKWYHSGWQWEPLQIHVNDHDDEGIFRINYDYLADLFTMEQMERLHGYLCNVLRQGMQTDTPISALPMLGEQELTRLMRWNKGCSEDPFHKYGSVCEQIGRQAAACPHKVAVYACDETLTYGELESRSDRIAEALVQRGIGSGKLVAVMLPRNGMLLPALLGVLKTGAAYVPVDMDYPRERVEFILEDSAAAYCLTEQKLRELLDSGGALAPAVSVTADMPCYCIYTSGSTGKPKGVLVTHGNLANYIAPEPDSVWQRSLRGVQTIVSTTTVSFDIFATESWLPLSNGMTVVLADEEQSRNQFRLNALLALHPAEALQSTPSKLRLLTASADKSEYLIGLRVLLLGGEPIDPALVAQLRSRTSARIFNYYGPTETTVWATGADITEGDITIGTPLTNTQAYILDRFQNVLPVGVVGELCIGGRCVGVGYLNQPKLTAEKFVADPFKNGKMYRTGDLACRCEDGNIIFIGRNDLQVKIRGQRVELGEIENALMSVQGVAQAAVLVRTAEDGGQLLCAYYSGSRRPAGTLRAELAGLPVYMIPHRFVFMEKLPLTPSGKTDRKAMEKLPVPDETEAPSYVPPHTQKERALAEAVNAVLHREKTGMEDNFLQLGGDSLRAIELAAILEERGYDLPVKEALLCRDMRALAQKITLRQANLCAAALSERRPATAAQQRIFTAYQLSEDPLAYHISISVDAAGVDMERLQKAVQEMLSRHESLRTHFELTEGTLWQITDASAVITVEHLAPEDALGFVRPFDLNKAPLMRLGFDGRRILFDFQHLVFDGSSIPVFFRELDALYEGRALLPAASCREYRLCAAEDMSVGAYWRSIYAKQPAPLHFGAGLSDPNDTGFGGRTHFDRVEKELHEQILHCCGKLKITPFSYYFGAYGLLLSVYGRNRDFSVGVPAAGRTPENLNAVGMFTNTVPLRCTIENSHTVERYLKGIAAESAEAFAHQQYPYCRLLKDLGRGPTEDLFSAVFAYQNELDIRINLAGEKRTIQPLSTQSAQYDLSLHIVPEDGGMRLAFVSRTRCFAADAAGQMADAYQTLLRQMLNLSQTVGMLSAVSDRERAVLDRMNRTDRPLTGEGTVYSYFRDQALKTPNEICLTGATGNLTYRDFEERVSCLDNRIRKLTDGKKQPVAVLADRGPEMYLALYAAVRGGNAYVPIAPSDPPERIGFLLRDSGAALVLAQDTYAHHACGLPVISLTAVWAEPVDEAEVLPCAALPEDIAYILYTSGSTGRAKGVRIRNSSVVNRILWMQRAYSLTESSVILGKTPYTFDVSVWEIFWWGMCGGRLAYMAPNEHFLPERITADVRQYGVTHLHFVPSVFALLLDYLEAEPSRRDALRSVRHIFLSGELLPAALVRRMQRLCPTICLHNLYGPTECTVDVSFYDCIGTEQDPVPIGVPIDNTRMYVVDENMNRLPLGVQGELCVAGAGVGDGYVDRPEMTAEKFVPNPFGRGKLYRTGDLAYVDRRGMVIFCGREDTQVKLHGRRVELGEIEAVLRQIPDIVHACVLVQKSHGRTALAAYYNGVAHSDQALRDRCAQKLPQYMIPAYFIRVETWPVTANGKADRSLLAAIPPSEESCGKEAPPVDETERQICSAFGEILHLEKVGRDTDFFRAGGTSLDVIAFLSSNERYAGLSAAAFLRDPTPAGIAARLREKNRRHLLQPLREAEGSKVLVLLPYAGGDAEAFSALVTELVRKRPDLTIAFLPFLHSDDDCRAAAEEVAGFAGDRQVSFYGHCVGSIVALRILRIMETEHLTESGALFSGAYIPVGRPFDIWTFTPNRFLRKILSKAGSRIEELPPQVAVSFLSDFRRDAAASVALLREMGGKCAVPVHVLVGDRDIFTPRIHGAEKKWARYVDGGISVTQIKSRSHYFQSAQAGVVADWLIGRLDL